jgi:hypothetical protein
MEAAMPDFDFKRLGTIKQIAQESGGAFTEASLRWMRFNGQLDEAVVKIGRRVLLDRQKLSQILYQNRAA